MQVKTCPTCKIEKVALEFSKWKLSLDGLQSRCKSCEKVNREARKVELPCKDCGEILRRDVCRLKSWEGRCRSCAPKERVKNYPGVQQRFKDGYKEWIAIPENREKVSERSRQQVINQGGIPNAVHFTSERVTGEASYNWKGGITPESKKLRSGTKSVAWRKAILQRDHFTCQLCNQLGYKLQAHHKKAWSAYPELRYDLENGVTLCEDCHKNKAHSGAWRNPPIEWNQLIKEI